MDGFHEAADEREIDHLDMLWIQRRGAPHLYRTGQLPPLRGTSVKLDPRSLLLYTRGSIPYFRTYPGMYVPQPLLIRSVSERTDLTAAGKDILALSKMNWNNSQLEERDPLTVRTSYSVGSILKHVPADARIATRYVPDRRQCGCRAMWWKNVLNENVGQAPRSSARFSHCRQDADMGPVRLYVSLDDATRGPRGVSTAERVMAHGGDL